MLFFFFFWYRAYHLLCLFVGFSLNGQAFRKTSSYHHIMMMIGLATSNMMTGLKLTGLHCGDMFRVTNRMG